MQLIIGLGNPGFRYKKTRHNAGFLAIDYIQKNIGGFSKWKLNRKLQAEISEGNIASLRGADRSFAHGSGQAPLSSCDTMRSFVRPGWTQDDNTIIILAKPQTYMNESGIAVKSLVANYQLPITNLFVIHDDFDIPIGEFKLEQNRGAAGHKGVQSIIDALGTNEFWRLRIGIRPINIQPDIKADLSAGIRQPEEKAEDFVLKKFTREERKIIEKIIPEAVNELLDKFEN